MKRLLACAVLLTGCQSCNRAGTGNEPRALEANPNIKSMQYIDHLPSQAHSTYGTLPVSQQPPRDHRVSDMKNGEKALVLWLNVCVPSGRVFVDPDLYAAPVRPSVLMVEIERVEGVYVYRSGNSTSLFSKDDSHCNYKESGYLPVDVRK